MLTNQIQLRLMIFHYVMDIETPLNRVKIVGENRVKIIGEKYRFKKTFLIVILPVN